MKINGVTIPKEMKNLILKGDEYMKNGHPLKDAMDDYDICEAIELFAEIIRNAK